MGSDAQEIADDLDALFGKDQEFLNVQNPSDDQNGAAAAESDALANERDLEKEGEENQHNRRERVRDHIGSIAVVGVWGLLISLGLIGGTLLYHYIVPECWRYLEAEDVNRLRDLLSSALVGVVLGYLAKTRFF